MNDATQRRTVYVSIGNSDDKLPQVRWHEFWVGTRNAIIQHAEQIHGEWLSVAVSPYQNACICFEIRPASVPVLAKELRGLAAGFGQDSIAWAEVAATEFLKPQAGKEASA